MNAPIPSRWSPYLSSVLRIVSACTFITHGSQKLLAFPVLEPRNPVPLLSLFGVAGVLELVGGSLLFLGLFTRPVALLLSGHMAAAYFTAHASRNFRPILNGGEVAVLFCFLWLFLAATGAWPLESR